MISALAVLDGSPLLVYSVVYMDVQGLALTAAGNYDDGIKAQCKAVELDEGFKEGLVHLAQVLCSLLDALEE